MWWLGQLLTSSGLLDSRCPRRMVRVKANHKTTVWFILKSPLDVFNMTQEKHISQIISPRIAVMRCMKFIILKKKWEKSAVFSPIYIQTECKCTASHWSRKQAIWECCNIETYMKWNFMLACKCCSSEANIQHQSNFWLVLYVTAVFKIS